MMGYLDRLKRMNSEKCPSLPLPKPPKAPYGSFDSRDGARLQNSTPLARPVEDAATDSRWRLHLNPDREPVEVASFPDTTHFEILERNPVAIAAAPIEMERNQLSVIKACSTCAHVTGRGGCGNPVAAGLSELEGVICYGKDGGAMCQVWSDIGTTDLDEPRA
jgi:hypothetical protein